MRGRVRVGVKKPYQMRKAAKNLEFEKAALLRDRIIELRRDEEILSPLTRFNKE